MSNFSKCSDNGITLLDIINDTFKEENEQDVIEYTDLIEEESLPSLDDSLSLLATFYFGTVPKLMRSNGSYFI